MVATDEKSDGHRWEVKKQGVFMEWNVVVELGEDGWFVAHAPALAGCWSQGKTRLEALQNIREAIAAWLEVEKEKDGAA